MPHLENVGMQFYSGGSRLTNPAGFKLRCMRLTLWHDRASIATCSRSIYQIFIRISGILAQMPRKVSPEAQDIPRHGSGAQLRDRSRHMMNHDGFHGLGTFNEAPETLQEPRGPRWRAMMIAHDSQSSTASVFEAKLVEASI